jgi:hypothetical protein
VKVQTDLGAAPEELKPAMAMIVGAFGDELPDKYYYPLLTVLGRQMSFRQSARLAEYLLGIRYATAYDDMLGVAAGDLPGCTEEDVRDVEGKLREHGYELWLSSL